MKKKLAEDRPDGAQVYRTRVEEAQLPADVREAALVEVGKLERTSDQSPESGDIRTWLDTILDLPWGTKTTDWMDIQESREVEATLRSLIEPGVADIEEGDTADVDAVAADSAEVDLTAAGTAEVDTERVDPEKADTAPADTARVDTAEVDQETADTDEADTAEVEAVAADTTEVEAGRCRHHGS